MSDTRPHHERWFYRRMYSSDIFEFTRRIYPVLGRGIYRAVARRIAWTYATTQHGVRDTVAKNLRLIAPEATERDAVRVFTNFGSCIADYIAIGCESPAKVDTWCRERSGREHLDEAMSAGNGAVLATGHYGLFEYGSLLIHQMGWKISIVTAPEPSTALTTWRAQYRARWGAETIEMGGDAFSSLRVRQVLEGGGFAAMLIDRPFGDFATPVQLPGGTLRFSMSAALVAYLADAPIVPVVIAAIPRAGYRMVALPAIWPRRLGLPRDEAIRTATEQAARALTAEFARDITQWYQFPPLQ